MSTASVKVIIEVQAGIVPGTAEPMFTRRWTITSAEWQEAEEKEMEEDHIIHPVAELLAERGAVADEYARMLRDPRRLNWVRTDWLWL